MVFNIAKVSSSRIIDFVAYTILGLATILRLFDLGRWSLSNDELSSWSRAQYQDLSSLIELGIRPDGHPAFGQFFLFLWLKLVPDQAELIRLPYALLSCIGLYFFYAFARKMYGHRTALPFLICLSFSFLFVSYHQIARPYALGFFMIAAMAYFWIKLIKSGQLKFMIAYSLFGALSLYTHYVLSLSILCLALSGFVFVYKQPLLSKKYLIANLIILVLFLPHLGLTLSQFSKSGLDWLEAPKSDFLIDFFEYSLNHSWVYILLIAVTPLLPMLRSSGKLKPNARPLLPLLLFSIPFLIVYYYSLEIKPILQFSMLIFSFPFLLLFFFSFLRKVNNSVYWGYSLLLFSVATLSLVLPSNTLQSKPFANFEGVSEHLIDWDRKFEGDLLSLISVNECAYIDYYLRQSKTTSTADLLCFNEAESLRQAINKIARHQEEKLSLSFANLAPQAELYEFARIHYPKLLESHRYYNSAAWLLGKEEDGHTDRDRPYTFYSTLSGSVHADRWEMKADFYQDSLNGREKEIFNIDESEEFPVTYRGKIKHAFREGSKWLTVRARLKSKTESGLALVAATSREGKSIGQRQISTDLFQQADQWYWSVLVYELPENARENDELTVYFWNPNHSKAVVDKIELVNFDDSDFDYYQWP